MIFYVKIATPLPEKSHPLFPSNTPPLNVEVLSSPAPLKTWMEVQPPQEKGEVVYRRGDGVKPSAHYEL